MANNNDHDQSASDYDVGSSEDTFGFVGPGPSDFPTRRLPDATFPTGPAVGEHVPEFQLRNQRGELIDFPAALGGNHAIVTFNRSAVW